MIGAVKLSVSILFHAVLGYRFKELSAKDFLGKETAE
jgi:hypothetical protein